MEKLKSETIEVNSKAIKRAKYNYRKKILRITFQNNSSYDYHNVPSFTFEGMRQSKSIGGFINRYILKTFDFSYAE